MKKNLLILIASSLIGLVMTTVSCDGEGTKTKTEVSAENLAFLRLDIDGMTCPDGCAKPIEQMLSEAEGVSSAEVDFEKKAAFINYDKTVTSEEKLMKLIADYKNGAYSSKASAHQCAKDCEKACCAKKCAADCTKPCCLAKKAKKATNDVVTKAKETGEDAIKRTKQEVNSAASRAAGKLNSTTSKIEKGTKNTVKEVENKIIRTKQSTNKAASRSAVKIKTSADDTKKAVKTEVDKLKGSN